MTTTAVTTTAVTTTTAATTTNVTTTTPTTTTTPAPPGSGPDPVVAAAGDIACGTTATNFNGGLGAKSACRQKWTSDLMLSMSNLKAVLPLGDVQYECGDAPDYAASYNPSWGRLKSITHWATGNHEYGQSCGRNDDSASNAYFGATNPKGWSSYDVGAWHVIVINSECSYGTGVTKVGGCNTGSPQEAWLKQDLAAHANACTLAYWHEPRFSSGEHGDALQMNDIWNDLVAAHVDVVLSGHNHDYERFEPIGAAPAGQVQPNLDPSGIRAFVVGTGGKNHYAFAAAPLNGEVIRDASTFGVLKLTLHANSYDWQFVNDPGIGNVHRRRHGCLPLNARRGRAAGAPPRVIRYDVVTTSWGGFADASRLAKDSEVVLVANNARSTSPLPDTNDGLSVMLTYRPQRPGLTSRSASPPAGRSPT